MTIDALVGQAATFLLSVIRHFGYGGILILMALESACIPIPSEIVLTFSGYLVGVHALNLAGVVLAGTAGNLLGSLIAYAIGLSGARHLLASYGRYLLISPRDMARADRWFARHGEGTVFIGRLLPVLRTFISLPAGIARMRLAPFIGYSLAGSAIWCLALTVAGMRLGQHWQALGPYMHWLDRGVAAAGLILAALYIRSHRRSGDAQMASKPPKH
ncbi:MAG: DedA family protein [Gammaproteobacteria bacterium]|nr:DedA family protein [Gammaproteobacteria bacterium]